jgi:hypothetical protein
MSALKDRNGSFDPNANKGAVLLVRVNRGHVAGVLINDWRKELHSRVGAGIRD